MDTGWPDRSVCHLCLPAGPVARSGAHVPVVPRAALRCRHPGGTRTCPWRPWW